MGALISRRMCCSEPDDAYLGQVVQYYGDLPDNVLEHSSVRKESLSRFKPHKIVSTFECTSYPSHPPSKRKYSKKHRVKIRKTTPRRTYTDSIFSSLQSHTSTVDAQKEEEAEVEGTELCSQTGFTHILPPLQLAECLSKPYVLYREGSILEENSKGDTATTPLHTITTRRMSEIDINPRHKSSIFKNPIYLNHIISRCPKRYHWMRWDLKYSILNDGCSIKTLYHKVDRMEDSLLIIRDDTDHVFGAFLDCRLKFEDFDHSYHGSIESFVFKFEFKRKKYSIFEYHHTGTEPYILDCNSNGITIGKGECPAIFIQKDLLKGSTLECDTFRSEVLTPRSPRRQVFTIKDLEIWCPTSEFLSSRQSYSSFA